jgi:Tfp pilus assembly protein FimT
MGQPVNSRNSGQRVEISQGQDASFKSYGQYDEEKSMRLSNKFDHSLQDDNNPHKRGERGGSLIELLIVVVVIMIVAGFSLFAVTGHKAMYKTDDQALQIIDVLRAASLRAVTQRQTIRVEINLTTSRVQMIDENDPAISTDDAVVRSYNLEKTTDVKLSAQPLNVTTLPPTPSNFPVAVFASSLHPLSTSNSVCTIRFARNGTVLNAGTNALGANAAITSTTLFIWPPQAADQTRAKTLGSVRAITIFGSTGNIRFWKFNGTSFVLE